MKIWFRTGKADFLKPVSQMANHFWTSKTGLIDFLIQNVLNRNHDGAVLLVGHAILWMGFIWAFCENKPRRINDGFMSKTHLSVISKNGKGYMLDQINLNHKEISNLKQPFQFSGNIPGYQKSLTFILACANIFDCSTYN